MMNNELVNDYDLSSVQSASVGAAPMDENATKMFKKRFPDCNLIQGTWVVDVAAFSKG